MKKSILFLCAALVVMFTSCSQEMGDQNEVDGKPGVLTINIKNAASKTRAMGIAKAETDDDENTINNFTVFLYNAAGAAQVMPPMYFGDGSTTVDIAVDRTKVGHIKVVANLGSPYDDGTNSDPDTDGLPSALYTALTASGVNGDIKKAAIDFSSVLQVNGAETGNGVAQSGEDNIDWTGVATGAKTIDINMYYIPARISLETVTLWGETIYQIADGTTAKTDANNMGIKTFVITNVHILNTPKTTHLVKQADENLYIAKPAGSLYSGMDVAPFTSTGTYKPTKTVVVPTNNYLTEAISNPISTSSTTPEYPYFYVCENAYDADTDGVTLLVIECEFSLLAGQTITGYTETSTAGVYKCYYTIPLDKALARNTTGDYSTKRNVHYHITADISSIGQPDPYTPLPLEVLGLTLIASTWDDEADIAKDFY